MKGSNKRTTQTSTSPTSRKSTEKSSKQRSAKSSEVPVEAPSASVAKQTPEIVYNVVQIDLTTSETVVLEFPALADLGQHLSQLVNKDYQVFIFEGQRCHITKGPFRYLKLPDGGAVPLFRAPSFQEMEIDDSGIMSEYVPIAADPFNSEEEVEDDVFGDDEPGDWPFSGDPLESDNFGDVEDTPVRTEEEEEYLESDGEPPIDWRHDEDEEPGDGQQN